ncbi:MAG: YitT family protein [Deltaproteobacteria bacterium]|nr:MAG: YitT family protein [Deltaproteobacteria bacterium]
MEIKLQAKDLHLDIIAKSWKTVLYNLCLISAGSLIFVIGMNSVLIPSKLLSAGVTGIALIFHYLFPKLNVGLAYFLLNIPLMLLGFFSISRRFLLYTLYGMGFFSLAAAFIKPPPAVIEDPILAALFAGIICGAGVGVILRSIGSTGGIDILAVYVNQKFGLRPGSVSFVFNAMVLIVGAHFFGLQIALYTLIYVFTSSRVLDAVLTGFNQRMATMVISEKTDEMAKEIFKKVNRGVTFLKGKGAYTGKERDVIFTVTTLTELPKLKDVIFGIDPGAFVVVNNTLEVLGRRHGSRKVY